MNLTEFLPEIPTAEQTPLVKQWVSVVEHLAERVEQLKKLRAQLKDERVCPSAADVTRPRLTSGVGRVLNEIRTQIFLQSV